MFTLHDLWTEQFRIFVYDNQNFKYDAASYLNNNIAYTGLENKERQFYVNGYNPASKANRIKLIPGGQT